MHAVQTPATISLGQLAAYFIRLGFIGFGGPPAHIALMRNDLVEKRKWISSEQFNDDLATANLIPGPTSTEMSIYMGYRLQGVWGAVLSGVCFIAPAFCIVLLLSIGYVQFGTLSQVQKLLYGIKPVALALVVFGTAQLGKPILQGWREWLLFALALAVIALGKFDVLLVFVISGIALVALNQHRANLFPHLLVALTSQAANTAPPNVLAVFLTFLKIGALIYGGGFALIGILQQEIVRNLGWINQQQLLDAIAIGQATPGPVFTTATFVGYLVAGVPGAIAGTVGIFAPAFFFVVLENKLLGQIKSKPYVKIFLRGVNAAVVASIAIAAAQIAKDALIDPLTIIIFVGALLALLRFKLDAHWLVLAGVLIGIGRALV